MRQRQPDGAELQQAGSLGVEYSTRDVDVRHGVAVEQQTAMLKVVGERYKRNAGGELSHERGFTIPMSGRLDFHPRGRHSR